MWISGKEIRNYFLMLYLFLDEHLFLLYDFSKLVYITYLNFQQKQLAFRADAHYMIFLSFTIAACRIVQYNGEKSMTDWNTKTFR